MPQCVNIPMPKGLIQPTSARERHICPVRNKMIPNYGTRNHQRLYILHVASRPVFVARLVAAHRAHIVVIIVVLVGVF
jgi:hypothetical protein